MPRFKLAVCQARAEMRVGDRGWRRLVDQVRALKPDVLVLIDGWISNPVNYRTCRFCALRSSLGGWRCVIQ